MYKLIKKYLANQSRKPSGWFGLVVISRALNKKNKEMERFGLSLMDPKEDDHILEIGFGNGQLIAEITPRIKNGRICGIDISKEMVALVSKREKKWIDQGLLEIRQASIENIPYPDKYFDKVFTANTIYFWPEPRINIQEVKRVLKTGGIFLCALRLKKEMELMAVISDNKDIFKNLYHKEEIANLFRESGFRDVNLFWQADDGENLCIVRGAK